MKPKIFLMLLILVFTTACSYPKKHYSCNELDSLSDIAIKSFNAGDSTSFRAGLSYINQAIECDSVNFKYYQKKIDLLGRRQRYHDIIKAYRLYYHNIAHSDPSVLITTGLIYESINQEDSSQAMYDLASADIDSLLKTNNVDTSRLLISKLFLTAVTEGKDDALKELDSLTAVLGRREDFTSAYSFLMNFDKQAILSTIIEK